MRRAAVTLCVLVAIGLATGPRLSGQSAPQPPAAPAPPAPTPIALPPELARVLRDYEAAWRAGDGARLAALFVEDGFAIQSGRPVARGRVAIGAAIAGPGGPLMLEAYAYSTSGTVGYIVGGYRYDGHGDAVGRFVLALRQHDGRWLIAADLDNAGRR
jgi:ketosteroid isomerase-like protein